MDDLVGRLLSEIEKYNKLVAIIGDVMIDRWVHGHLAQCQDGCPKFVQEEVVEVPGGAANAEQSLHEWTGKTWLFGYSDNDCPIKCRYVEGDKIVFRADNDRPITRSDGYRWARNLAMEVTQSASGVLLSDYDKGFLTPEFIRDIVAICKRRDVPCVADVKRGPEVYAECILKGNKVWRGRYDIEELPARYVITQGDMPPYGYDRDHAFTVNVRCDVPSINHVGAGDCFAAHLTLALAYGFSLKEAAVLAHSAGRVYVQHRHNRPPHPSEIAADLATAK